MTQASGKLTVTEEARQSAKLPGPANVLERECHACVRYLARRIVDMTTRMHSQRRLVLPVVIIILLSSRQSSSAVLSGADVTAAAGQAVVSPLVFSAQNQAISALQFDLDWDASLDVKLVIGTALRQSTKLLYTAPRGPQTIRCLIAGMDSLAVPEGELVKAYLTVSPQASPGTARLRVINTTAAGPTGNSSSFGPTFVNVDIQKGAAASISLLPDGILNAASLLPGPVSPGEIITLLGGLPEGNVTLLFNGISMPVIYSGLNQVNAIVPFGSDPSAPGNLDVRIGGQTARLSFPVAPVSPAIFTQTGTGSGPGAILNADYSLNSAANPATRGSIVMLFGTGFGVLDPQPADGQIAGAAAPTQLPVAATVGAVPAAVTYAGAAPGLVAGAVQINVKIPLDIAHNGAAPVSLSVGPASTPAGVTVAIQ
jgi:uncharacterized protein (TIGR03437 family)